MRGKSKTISPTLHLFNTPKVKHILQYEKNHAVGVACDYALYWQIVSNAVHYIENQHTQPMCECVCLALCVQMDSIESNLVVCLTLQHVQFFFCFSKLSHRQYHSTVGYNCNREQWKIR